MRRGYLALFLAVLVSVAACSSNGHSSAPPSPNPNVIPKVITVAYVNAVFAVLNHVNGDATRALIANASVTPEVLRDLRAIYGDSLYPEEVKIAQETITAGLSNFRRPPGDIATLVQEVQYSSPSCIFWRYAFE